MQPPPTPTHQNKRMDERVILKMVREGSREALGMLWSEHSSKVLNLAFRMLRDRDEAEDILMDVFVQVPSAIKSFKGQSAVSTWLYRLTVNACLMKLRAGKRHRKLEEEHLDTIIEEALGTGETTSDFDPTLLEKGLAQLNAETRSMLWLKDAEDLDVKDLAEIYKMPEGTVKARLSRARSFVRNYINERKASINKECNHA